MWRQGACQITATFSLTPTWPQNLGAICTGAETCKLDVNYSGAEMRVYILKSYLQGHICEKLSKKRAKKTKIQAAR